MNQENLVDRSMLGTFTAAYQGRSVQESRCKDELMIKRPAPAERSG